MCDRSKYKFIWRRKRGRDTLLFNDLCRIVSRKTTISEKDTRNTLLAFAETLIDEIKKSGMVSIPGLGSLGLIPGTVAKRGFGQGVPHSKIHFWADQQLYWEVRNIPPSPGTIRPQDTPVVAT